MTRAICMYVTKQVQLSLTTYSFVVSVYVINQGGQASIVC